MLFWVKISCHTIRSAVHLANQIWCQAFNPTAKRRTRQVRKNNQSKDFCSIHYMWIKLHKANISHIYIISCTFHIWSLDCLHLQTDIFPCTCCRGGRRGSWSHIPLWTKHPHRPQCCHSPYVQHSAHSLGVAALCDCWTARWGCCTAHI